MVIHKLVGEECKKTRSLWEEVFWEDSVQFTDYYFEHKAKLNTGYVIGEFPYHAMLFRTPYMLHVENVVTEISYLVGVATRKEYRKRGYMRALLEHSFKEMYEEKQPFTFLMPANPAIYEPFDFRYIYTREQWELKDDQSDLKAAEFSNNRKGSIKDRLEGIYPVSWLCREVPQLPIFEMLAEYANGLLKDKYSIYVHRDVAYYERQLEELKAQNGDIYVFFEQGRIEGFYLYAKENEDVFIQEVLKQHTETFDFMEKSGQKPIIMARIIHLEEMMKLVKTKCKKEIVLQVEDSWIPENAGTYRWKMGPRGSEVERLKDGAKADYKMHISELTPHVLKGAFLNEIV